ncbi:MscS Mechanosensitive ion channel [Paludibacter propionicigenes WB4]|uniref:MscS Mechanosensitive ion channel n=1 Tax=Paludibacter propionicigenes (strain DSM 17365 / JCM 13257 / WB4) TaxID=694427 RepID=E4T3Y2_PALPW|nr:mechanosensitive ion channel family protein [Paludibacter propionicigenes]ADQ79426.1 MscS Mechanosensitive ion channel [Paludibacter propionicigenes WB4]
MFEQIFYKNSLRDWLISLAIIAGALILNKIIILLNKHLIQKLTAKTKNRLDDILFKMLQAPVLLGIILVAIWFAARRLELGTHIESTILKAYKVLTVINITWFVARLANALLEEYLAPKAADKNTLKYLDNHLMSILRRAVLAVIWSFGVVMALNNVGVNVGTLIAGLSIGGLAFALAAQDTIKNIYGGFTIFTDRPFRIGDRIKVDSFDGFVEEIGIRSTRIRTLEKRLVTIPNYKLVEASVENISEEPMRRVLMKLGLTYNTTPEKMNEAMSILRDMPNRINNVFEKDIVVAFTDFTDFALVITFVYFIRKNADVMETPSLVNSEILRAFNAAGLQFAYPTQTIYIEKD